MKKIAFALVGATALALAACGSQNDDALGDEAGTNLGNEELNALADEAAEDAQAEMDALNAQQQQLEAEPVANDAATEPAVTQTGVVTEPSEVEDEPLGL